MKIATFNINDVNKRLENLLAWLPKALRTLSASRNQSEQGSFPPGPIRDLGYHAIWHGERSWNGVAILAGLRAGADPLHSARNPEDRQARYIEAAVNGS